MHTKTLDGYVLLLVLVFLQIFFLLGLSGLSSSIATLKTNGTLWKKLQDNLHARFLLHQIANTPIKQSCLLPILSTDQLKRKSQVWWHKYTCSPLNYYVIEFLGINPCAQIKWLNKMFSAKFYRISLAIFNDHEKFDKYIFQSVIAIPHTELLSCTEKPYQIDYGEQMFREL